MAKTLGQILNNALNLMGEPSITSIDTDNILQKALIAESNNAVRDILSRYPFSWGYKRTTLTTTTQITTGTCIVTNGSTTVTSSGDNWGSATTSMWFRVTGDTTSYEITTVTTAGSPDTLTLTETYKGTSNSTASYTLFQDTYALSTTDLDDPAIIAYGDAANWANSLAGGLPNNQVSLISLKELFDISGGDLHRDTSGRPKFMARISVNSSNYPRYILWPYPNDDYLMELWYSILYSENSTFSTDMFAADAPQMAYDAVEHRVKWRAYKWDRKRDDADDEMKLYQLAIGNLLRRENRPEVDHSIGVERYSRRAGGNYPGRSITYFDLKSARR